MRVLVACFGNVLRGDDGFGVAVARRLVDGQVPADVEVLEIGTGGIHLVQELLDGADGLVIVDAVDLGRPPGTVVVLEPDARDLREATVEERRDELADMHYATPDRAMTLARALDVLPERTVLVGCQVEDPDGLGDELSPVLEAGLGPAVGEVKTAVRGFGVVWP